MSKKQEIRPVKYVVHDLHPSWDMCWREGCGDVNIPRNAHQRIHHPDNGACTKERCECPGFIGALDEIDSS